ncbi:hypothetical protein [Azospirillum sp. TSO5]|uniref:hypothetical protein n=1 Tax=Azospirillum sp. TSO5 TaxID=716760 RepID=UPI0011B232B9|nr:hypothetical protein [Azospirillum sp. TSO5]
MSGVEGGGAALQQAQAWSSAPFAGNYNETREWAYKTPGKIPLFSIRQARKFTIYLKHSLQFSQRITI